MSVKQGLTILLLRRFVFRMVEASASDWWWTARDHGKGTHGRRSDVSPVVSFPPSFARTFSSRERRLGTWQGFDCISFQSVEYFKPSLQSNRFCWSLAETLATQTILSDAFSKENFQKYATASSVYYAQSAIFHTCFSSARRLLHSDPRIFVISAKVKCGCCCFTSARRLFMNLTYLNR